MARLLSVKITLKGAGWQKMRKRLRDAEIGVRDMAKSRWLIGTSLPYASHWIEEGWRNDPRYGRVQVHYRTPETYFMRGAVDFMYNAARRRAAAGPVGIRLGGAMMAAWAQKIAENMRGILNARVYSAPVPTRNGRARWARSHKLFNSIKAYRA